MSLVTLLISAIRSLGSFGGLRFLLDTLWLAKVSHGFCSIPIKKYKSINKNHKRLKTLTLNILRMY
jgi:hypothetical protein